MDEVKRCPKCGKPIIDQFVYCPFCGAEIEPKCKNCGKPIVEGAKFCANCGTPVCENAPIAEEKTSSNLQETNGACAEYAAPVRVRKRQRRHVPKKAIVALVKSAFVVLVCILTFAFSFAGVVSINVEDVLADYVGDTVTLENGNINLYAVDFIKIMFATTRHYNEDKEKDARKIEKLENAAEKNLEELIGCLEDDARGSKIVLSAKSKRAANALLVSAMEWAFSVDSMSSFEGIGIIDGASITEVCTTGALLFVNIFMNALLLAFAIVELVKTIRRVVGAEDVKVLNKLDAFLPLLIVLPVAAIFALSLHSSYIMLASELVAGLVFSSLAVLFVLALSMVKDVKKHGSINVIIPKIITIAMCVIVIGCCFAPVLKGTFEVQLSGEEKEKEYDIDLYAESFVSGILSNAQEDAVKAELKETRRWDYFTEQIQTVLSTFSFFSEKTLYQADGAIIRAYSNSVTASSCMAQLGLAGAQSLSVAYFALMATIILCGGCMCGAISSNRSAQLLCSLFMVIMLIAAISISVVMKYTVDFHMDTMDSYAFSLNVGGGCISAAIIGIVAIVFSAIPQRAWAFKREKLVEYVEEA